MVSLTMAPCIKGHTDWQGWGAGLVPLIITVAVTRPSDQGRFEKGCVRSSLKGVLGSLR